MNSYSQAGQDVWVRRILGENKPRFFLDIGCAGDQYSNTLALEQEGWTGILVDVDDTAKGRKTPFVRGDATKIRLPLPDYVDYLSLDIDFGTYDALVNILSHGVKFGIITIEHDAYRFGDELRVPERALLNAAGYTLICADVCGIPEAPFEDWWISKELYSSASEYIGAGQLWSDIIK